jgi:hypothetical protein
MDYIREEITLTIPVRVKSNRVVIIRTEQLPWSLANHAGHSATTSVLLSFFRRNYKDYNRTPTLSYLEKGTEMKTKKATALMKTVVTNVAHDLERYEQRDPLYEVVTVMTTGKLPTHYQVLRALAIGSRLVRNVITERESKGKS